MVPSIAVIPREGSFALAFFGTTRKFQEPAFSLSVGWKSFALKRIVVLVICFVLLTDADQATIDSRTTSASKRSERPIDAHEHFFFSEHFEQMIETRSHIAAGNRQTRGMNDGADFHSKLFRRVLQCRFDFGRVEFL